MDKSKENKFKRLLAIISQQSLEEDNLSNLLSTICHVQATRIVTGRQEFRRI